MKSVSVKYIVIAIVVIVSVLCASSIVASWPQRGFVMSPDYDGPVSVVARNSPAGDGVNYTIRVPWVDTAGKPRLSNAYFWSTQQFQPGQTAFVRNGELTTMPPL